MNKTVDTEPIAKVLKDWMHRAKVLRSRMQQISETDKNLAY